MYMLDTDICIYIAKRKPLHISERFSRLKPGDLCMSVITHAELTYGAIKSMKVPENLEKLSQLASLIPVLPLDDAISEHYGRIRTDLERKGKLIGGNDLFIAAHCLAVDAVLVTNNIREFSRVQGLNFEIWK